MKQIFLTFLLLCGTLTAMAAGRSVKISGEPEKITRVEIVKANDQKRVDAWRLAVGRTIDGLMAK